MTYFTDQSPTSNICRVLDFITDSSGPLTSYCLDLSDGLPVGVGV